MLEVTHAQYVKGYTIRVELSDGTKGDVDLEGSLWGTVFEPLRTIEEFKKFSVSPGLHTLTWQNDADFAPEHLKKLIEQAHAAASMTGR